MEGSAIITIIVVLFVVWALFFRTIRPENKTDEQLKWMYKKASANFRRDFKYNKELELIGNEMEKRGLLGEKGPIQDNIKTSPSVDEKFIEVNRRFEESGGIEEIKQMLSSDLPEKMLHKIMEISEVRGIPEHEASKLFNEMFEDISKKYISMGLSQDEADEKASKEVIETKISTKDDSCSAGVIGQLTEMGEVWNEVNPILSQMKKIPNISNGRDIFDPYIRGYFLGYIDGIIEMMGGKSIDASLDVAKKIFNIMFGAGFSDDNAGIKVLDECLEERAKQNHSGEFSFSKGFIEGAGDYKIFKSGRNPNSLTNYLLKTIQRHS